MALIELEMAAPNYYSLLTLVVTAAPIPVATFPPLGDDHLISELGWNTLEPASEAPGFTRPPGTMLARAQVTVRHVSVAELQASPGALGTAVDATAWLLITLRPDQLRIELVGIAFPGRSAYLYPSPVPVGFSVLPSFPVAVTVVNAAIVAEGSVVTLRLGTSNRDNVLLPPANRLDARNDDWLIRVSQELFTDYVLDTLRKGLDPPPAGAVIEDAPKASWSVLPLSGQWGVTARVGLKKRNACPGIFGGVNVSVAIGIVATFVPGFKDGSPDNTLGVNVRVASDASDWDAFRCWAATGGIGSLVLGPFVGPLMLPSAIGSLIAVGEIIRLGAGKEVTQTDTDASLKRVDADATSATYQGSWPLPHLERLTNAATVGPDGLVVSGTLPFLLPAAHETDFVPNQGTLMGGWSGRFNCSTRSMDMSYTLAPIVVTDRATVAGIATYAVNPVTVFPTSTALPRADWVVDIPWEPKALQSVEIKARHPEPGHSGLAIVHTSAGIRRFDIGAVPRQPAPIDDDRRTLLAKYCDTFVLPENPPGVRRLRRSVTELLWVEPPPEYDHGHAARRQWQLTIQALPEGTSLAVDLRRADEEHDAALITFAAVRSGPVSIELVTDGDTNLRLSHTLPHSPPSARLTQRWLLPLHTETLPGRATALVRTGDQIGVIAAERLMTFSIADWSLMADMPVAGATRLLADGDQFVVEGVNGVICATERHNRRIADRTDAAPTAKPGSVDEALTSSELLPFSITLADRRVVAVSGEALVVALPYGQALRPCSARELPNGQASTAAAGSNLSRSL